MPYNVNLDVVNTVEMGMESLAPLFDDDAHKLFSDNQIIVGRLKNGA